MKKQTQKSKLRLSLFLAATVFSTGYTSASSASESKQSCEFSERDTAWVSQATDAWHYTNSNITKISEFDPFDIILFDDTCQMVSSNAFSNQHNAKWNGTPHDGMVKFPDGDEMPPLVTSFTFASAEKNIPTFFVMSTPSVWEAGGVKSSMGLENLMTPVMLHEATHAIQSSSYGKQIEALAKEHNLPEDFNDDSVQKIFQSNEAFRLSVLKEIDLLMAASQAETDTEAHALATEAHDMIKTRYETWMVGDAEKYRDIDDVWLTMEGSGQWVGYSWLSADGGGSLSKEDAIKKFGMRSKWWSQKLGFALFMAVDRLSSDWKQDAFGDGNRTVLTLLDDALAQQRD